MTFFMPLSSLVPVHGVVQLASNFSRTWALRQHVNMHIFWPTILGTVVGVVLAVVFIKQLSFEKLPLLLIAALIFYTLFKPKKLPALVLPAWGFSILGMVAGFLGLLIGSTGPLLAPFFCERTWAGKRLWPPRLPPKVYFIY
jgi:uncharacterized membrane protein YfcA